MRIISTANMKALGALALLIPAITAAPNGRCEVGEVWRDLHDCHGFFECAAGRIPVRKVCGPGTAYNPHIGVCDYERKIPTCQRNDHGGQGSWGDREGHGEESHEKGDDHVWTKDARVTTNDERKKEHGCYVGAAWPDKSDCRKFWECAAGGIPVRKSCGPGTAYSLELGVCDYEWKVPSCHHYSDVWNHHGPGEDGREHGEEDEKHGEEGDKNFARKRKEAPVGQVITSCVEPNTIALTFDDGPSEYTEHFLDLLRDYDAHATFFVLGEAAQKHPELLRRIQDEQHQIGSHTFDHPRLPTLSHDAIVEEMTRLEDALIPIIRKVPTYMRPPYFDVSDEVLATMCDLGYKVIMASIDTKDYEHDNENAINVSYDKFLNELDAGGSIVLSHDTHYWTGQSLLERMLIEISERGLTATTVGDCLGEPLDAWYRPA